MSTVERRNILNMLETHELVTLIETFEIDVENTTIRASILDALADTQKATMGQMLVSLPRKRLKALCRKQGLDDSGREKSQIVMRLLGIDPLAPSTPKAVPPIRRRRRETEKT